MVVDQKSEFTPRSIDGRRAHELSMNSQVVLFFFFLVGGNGFQVFCFEDLTAVEALHVIDAPSSCNGFCSEMVTHTN
jgi:hypothetical protein